MNVFVHHSLTLLLWQVIIKPDHRDPLFRQTVKHAKAKRRLWWYVLLVFIFLIIVGLVAPILLIPLFFVIGVGIFLMIFLFSGATLGLYWTGAITSLLLAQKSGVNAELLGVLPVGIFGVVWKTAVATVHRDDWLRTGTRIVKRSLFVVLILLCAVLLVRLPTIAIDQALIETNFFKDILTLVGLAIFAGIDFVQSVILSLCIAIFVSTKLEDQLFAPFVARGLYLLTLIVTYMLALVIYGLIEHLLESLMIPILATHLLVITASLAGFMLIREGVLRYLWQVILQSYQVSHDEYSVIMQTETNL